MVCTGSYPKTKEDSRVHVAIPFKELLNQETIMSGKRVSTQNDEKGPRRMNRLSSSSKSQSTKEAITGHPFMIKITRKSSSIKLKSLSKILRSSSDTHVKSKGTHAAVVKEVTTLIVAAGTYPEIEHDSINRVSKPNLTLPNQENI